MPGIVPKNISTRQGGKVTSGTQKIGNPKSGGSASRMVSHCKSTGTSTDCVNTVLNAMKPIKPNIQENFQENISENDLFNRQSFNQYFNIDTGDRWNGIGLPDPFKYKRIDNKYLIPLHQAANRWARFLKVNDNATYFIRAVQDNNWNGIELTNFVISDAFSASNSMIAGCNSIQIPNTAIITGFELIVNLKKFNNPSLEIIDLVTVFTHEIGHGLGIASRLISINTEGEVILPLDTRNHDIQYHPTVLRNVRFKVKTVDGELKITEIPVFPIHVQEYINYGGWGTKRDAPWPIKKGIDQETVKSDKFAMVGSLYIPTEFDDIAHLLGMTIYTNNYDEPDINPGDDLRKYYYLGFLNEIMMPGFNYSINSAYRYYISRVSIGRLLDLRSETSNGTIYMYEEITEGASEVLSAQISPLYKRLYFSGVILPNFKNTNSFNDNQKGMLNNDNLFCKDCLDDNTKDIKNEDCFYTCCQPKI
jgi:hypothetical protein